MDSLDAFSSVVSRGRGMAPREAHNLQMPVRIRPPQHECTNAASSGVCVFSRKKKDVASKSPHESG